MALKDDKTKVKVAEMFNNIATKYDFLNKSLSLGTDIYWRKKIIANLPKKPNLTLLDLATGPADVPIACLTSHRKHDIHKIYGVDIAKDMLQIGQEKVNKQKLSHKIELHEGDATSLTFDDNTFDAVTISFGIRNVENTEKALQEIYRVLKPNGKAIILEFSIPKNKLIKSGYLTYFRHVLPHIGGWLSGNKTAYTYLNQTVETFPYGKKFENMMQDCQFKQTQHTPLTSGIATLYTGTKK